MKEDEKVIPVIPKKYIKELQKVYKTYVDNNFATYMGAHRLAESIIYDFLFSLQDKLKFECKYLHPGEVKITVDNTVTSFKKGDLIIDPVGHLNVVTRHFKNVVDFSDGCGGYDKSCQKVSSLEVNGVKIKNIDGYT